MHKCVVGIVIIFSFFLLICCSKSSDKNNENSNNDAARTLKMNPKDTPRIEITVNGTKIVLINGDITKLICNPRDNAAIVNAANKYLSPGDGVCGAIYEAAGQDDLKNFTSNLGNFPGYALKCPTGKAVITPSFNLSNAPYYIKNIIHAVGPSLNVTGSPTVQDRTDLESAYIQALTVAKTKGVRVIAFPCISTSLFGYPPKQAAPVAFQAVIDNISSIHSYQFDEIIFVCFLRSDYDIYAELFNTFQASH
jgi:O-acetyl-ADP-ribose deacetylase (regulator of RNase III)